MFTKVKIYQAKSKLYLLPKDLEPYIHITDDEQLRKKISEDIEKKNKKHKKKKEKDQRKLEDREIPWFLTDKEYFKTGRGKQLV